MTNSAVCVKPIYLRGKFWFSFMHEFHHIIEKHMNNRGETTSSQEAEAYAFARDALIPSSEYQKLTIQPINKISINTFDIEIGIVVGRLLKDKLIQFSQYNDLKTHYEIAE